MRALSILSALVLAAGAVGCSDDVGETSRNAGGPQTGVLKVALHEDGAYDVAGFAYKVVAAGESCDDGEAIAEAVRPLQEEHLPLLEGEHPFADAFFILPPGDYHVCATPVQEDGTPSEFCERAEGDATVFAGETTEIILISQCDDVGEDGQDNRSGGLDVIATLNGPPHIDDFDIDKFITICEVGQISIEASDPDGDTLEYNWEILSGPPGANAQINFNGPNAVFSTDTPGDYELRVTVSDGNGGEASLVFPMHVSECNGPVECEYYEILDSPTRNVASNDGDGGTETCDRDGFGWPETPDWLGANWYRFVDGAGVQMPEAAPAIYSCGTDAPGWLTEPHPTPEDGVVARTVCFNWAGDTCNWSTEIEVINCGEFYVYNLPVTPTCALTYCGVDAPNVIER